MKKTLKKPEFYSRVELFFVLYCGRVSKSVDGLRDVESKSTSGTESALSHREDDLLSYR